jgi:hypothetical protein
MNKDVKGLNAYAKRIHSQWGEDGILEEIFARIGTKNKYCVEFGAGNGSELSNIWHLIESKGWRGLLMDNDEKRCAAWDELLKDFPETIILRTSVDISGDRSLDSLLTQNNAPNDLDLLSIDIDSDDYHMFDSLKKFKPRVVIIEHNPTIPPGDALFQSPGEKESFGSSAQANLDLAHKKGYRLAAMTHTNSIFVIESEFSKLKIDEPSIEAVFDWSGLTHIISAYNGSIYLRNKRASDQQPSYGWLYKGYTIRLFKKAIHAFSFGLTFNARYSASLMKMYEPIKALKADKR